jgi:D-mannonate dehydratase
VGRDTEPDDPLEVFLDQFIPVDAGYLFAVAAAFHPDDPAHAEAWAKVRKVAAAQGMEPEIDRLRRRVAQWATQGTGYVSGHLGAGPAEEMLHLARAAVAGAILDGGVAGMIGVHLDDDTLRVLLRPWGLPELEGEAPADSV